MNARRVPPRYQEELTSSVSALVASIECPDAPGAVSPVAPIPVGSTPVEAARNLSNWLRENAR